MIGFVRVLGNPGVLLFGSRCPLRLCRMNGLRTPAQAKQPVCWHVGGRDDVVRVLEFRGFDGSRTVFHQDTGSHVACVRRQLADWSVHHRFRLVRFLAQRAGRGESSELSSRSVCRRAAKSGRSGARGAAIHRKLPVGAGRSSSDTPANRSSPCRRSPELSPAANDESAVARVVNSLALPGVRRRPRS